MRSVPPSRRCAPPRPRWRRPGSWPSAGRRTTSSAPRWTPDPPNGSGSPPCGGPRARRAARRFTACPDCGVRFPTSRAGPDAGRRQYLYHPQWRSSRDAAKFDRILGFGKALSKARERVLTDIGVEGMSQERACAVAVRLLDLGYFRIGNDVYTDTNGSFGLTTLRKDHVTKQGQALRFRFIGKSGIE